MKTDGRFIQHVQNPHQPAANLRGEADPLHLTARKRRARTVQCEIVEPDVVEESEPLDNLLEDVLDDPALLLREHTLLQATEKRERLAHRHRHHLDNRLPGDGGRAGLGAQPRAMAIRTRTIALVRLELLTPLVAFRVLHHPLDRIQHPFERLVLLPPGENEIVIEPVHEFMAEIRRQLLVGRIELHLVLLRDPSKNLVVVHDRHVSSSAPGMDALPQRQRLVRHHEIFVEEEDRSESPTGRARAKRRVEREGPWLQLVKGEATVGTGVLLGENEL